MDQKNLADLYNLPPIPWSTVLEALEGHNRPDVRCFLRRPGPTAGRTWQGSAPSGMTATSTS